jgi:hypothetical protein
MSVVVAYAGRRSASLPPDLDALAGVVRGTLEEIQPTAMVGAAADGSDLLVLEAALSLASPPEVHLVLPTALRAFAQDSVEPAWRGRFAAVLGAVQLGGTVRPLDRPAGADAYREANQAILDTALSISSGAVLTSLLVIGSPGEGAMVEDIVRRAKRLGLQTLRIDPRLLGKANFTASK